MAAETRAGGAASNVELVVVANRLPVHCVRLGAGIGWRSSPGGLVRALAPILAERTGVWVGWPGYPGEAPQPFEHDHMRLHPVALEAREVADFYEGFCNRTLWPLYHDALRPPRFRRDWWEPYVRVNRRFAAAVAEVAAPGALVWVHDYHLQLVPSFVRQLRPDLRIGFFLHIPFPPRELFAKLPWRRAVLDGMLGAHVVGFQTEQAARNFDDLSKRFCGATGAHGTLQYQGRTVRSGAFPVSIDVAMFEELASRPEAERRADAFRRSVGSRRIILGVDRLDYTKGIDIRLRAFAELLRSGRVRREECVFVQIAVPSRERVADYRTMRKRVERLVGQINGEFGEIGLPVLHYARRTYPPDQLVALYLASDVMAVTPLRDGMNLVAKEWVASRAHDRGVLLLSEFTGAAVELRSALLVNPHDIDGLAFRHARGADHVGRGAEAPRPRSASHRPSQHGIRLGGLLPPGPVCMSELESRLRELARTPVLLVASDYDGTVAPIVPDPSHALPQRESVVALRALANLPHTYVALISGRALRDLAALSRLPPEVHLVGSHGSEFDLDFAQTLSAGQIALRQRVLEELDDIARSGRGLAVEAKPANIAFHYRNADPETARRAVAAVLERVATLEGVTLRHGKSVLDVGVVATDKGDAVQTLRHRVAATAVVFLGDDLTDEDVFATLCGPDLAVKVGPGATRAPYRIDGTEDVARLLARLAELRSAWLEGEAAMPIERHSLLSDHRAVALLTVEGRIVWLCLPRVDSPAICAELVGGPTAGFFAVRPARRLGTPTQRYESDTMIVETHWPDLSVTDFLDCSGGRPVQRAGRSELFRIIEGRGRVQIEFAPRLDFGREHTRLEVKPGGIVVSAVHEPITLRAPGLDWHIEAAAPHQTARAEVDLDGGSLVLELVYGSGSIPDPGQRAGARLEATRAWWSDWTSGLRIPAIAPTRVRRSALLLKALCYEPTGAIIASATTSLPEEIGGVRNWDYRYCWLRDGALAATALAKLGSTREALRFLDWVLTVVDTHDSPAALRPLYTVTGGQLGAEAVIPELSGYRASRPVRVGNAAAQQLQLDVFGPIVDLLALLAERDAPLSSEHWRLVCAMVEAVESRWEEPDHGIWEIRRSRRHHVHSKVMCWLTVDRAIAVAEQLNGSEPPGWRALRDRIAAEILERGFSRKLNAFCIAYGDEEPDAATLHVGLSGLLAPDDPRFLGTVDAIEQRLLRGSVVFRYLGDDGLPGSEGGFTLCTGWLIRAYALLGRRRDAQSLFDRMLSVAGPTGLMSEEHDPISGEALGNVPQAFSHIAVIESALALSEE